MKARRCTFAFLSGLNILACLFSQRTSAQIYNYRSIAGFARYTGRADGVGTNTSFFQPAGIALDMNGNLLVTDSLNETIRKITSGGVVTTYAGSPRFSGDENNLRIGDGAGPSVRFHTPLRLSVGSAGIVYVTDGNNTIRKATPDSTGSNWTVTTIAGNASPFPAGAADGVGTTVLFRSPLGITVDAAGALYVAEPNNTLLRKLIFTGSDWAVTTVAGQLNNSQAKDGTGTNATFGGPLDIAADSAGNLWAADGFTVRKLTPSGTNWAVTTVAGRQMQGSVDGTGTNALFWSASGIAADGHGNAFVADSFNHNVRMLSQSGTNYVVTTIAGRATVPGSADGTGTNSTFYVPEGICVDNHSNVFVADSLNCTIRKISPDATGTNWVTATIAGQPGNFGTTDGLGTNALFFVPEGIAVDANSNLYVMDSGNNLLRKLSPSGTNWVTTTVAGALQRVSGPAQGAGFMSPMGVAVDTTGNAYVADQSFTVRKITTAPVVTTLAGQPGKSGSQLGLGTAAQFAQPTGVAVDTGGNVYVADTRNNQVRKVTSAGQTTIFAGSVSGWLDATGMVAKFNAPQGIAADAQGNLFIADTKNDVIRMITPLGVVSTLAGQPGVFGAADGQGGSAMFALPEGIAVDAHSNIYVADTANCTIRKLTLSGTNWMVATIAGQAGNSGSTDGTNNGALFNRPHGLVVDTNGIIYVADTFNGMVRKITPFGTNWIVTTFAGNEGGSANGMEAGINERLNVPAALILDASNNLFVADSGDCVIRELSPVGGNWIANTIAGLPGNKGFTNGIGLQAQFSSPSAIGMDAARNLYVADNANHVICKLTPSGTNWSVIALAGSPGNRGTSDGTNTSARFNTPRGVVPDSNGNLFVSDSVNNTIRKLTPSGTNWVVSTIAGQAGVVGSTNAVGTNALFYMPAGIIADASNNLYVADAGNSVIRQLTPSNNTWVVTAIAGQPGVFGNADGNGGSATFNWPIGITLDHLGNLFVADFLNCTIRKLTRGAGTNWTVTTVGGVAGVAGSTQGPGTNTLFFFPAGVVVDAAGVAYVADSANGTIEAGTPPPALFIVCNGGQVVLTWPRTATNYVLETTNSLPTVARSWTPITNGISITGSNFVVTNGMVGPAEYYRLRGQ